MTLTHKNIRTTHSQKSLPYLVLAGISIAFLGLYSIWLSSNYSGDDLQYATVIERYTTGKEFYHPTGTVLYKDVQSHDDLNLANRFPLNIRYVLEYPTSILIANLSKTFSGENGVIQPILWLRILVGIGGLIVFYLTMHLITVNVWISAITTIGLGTTLTYWTYSNHLDQSINMLFFLSTGLFIFVYYIKFKKGFILLPLLIAVAALYNFTAVLVAIITGVGMLFVGDYNEGIKTRMRKSINYYLIFGAVILLVFAISLSVISTARPLNLDFLKSAAFYGHPEYQMQFPHDIARALLGLAKSYINFPGYSGSLQILWENSSPTNQILLLAYYGIILVVLATPILFFLVKYRILRSEIRQIGLLLIFWFAIFTLFNIWWDPGYIKYWLVPFASWWALVGLILWHLADNLPKVYLSAYIFFVFFVGLGFLVNFTSQFYPESKKNENIFLNTALKLKVESQPQDLFISSGTPFDFYLPYFSHRNVISIMLLDYQSGGNRKYIHNLINSQIVEHTSVGGNIFLLTPLDSTPNSVNGILEMAKVQPGNQAWFFPGYKIVQLTVSDEFQPVTIGD